jgi:hypothetical protein
MLNISYQTDLAVKSQRTVLDQSFFNKRFLALYSALLGMDTRISSFEVTQSSLIQLGLERINTVLGPLLTSLETAQQLGFLVGQAAGVPHSLVEGEAEGFVITTGAALFTPTTYLLAEDDTDVTNWGILKLDEGGWTRETGDLATHCVYASQTKSSSSWTISASGAVLPAMQDLLVQAVAAKDAAEAAESTVSSDIATLTALIAAIEAGPVNSVAGKTGAVVLAIADIVGLTDALAAKASITSLNSGLAGKQNSSAKLTSLAGLTWATDKLLYFSDASTANTADFTAFARTLVACTTAALTRTALGLGALAVKTTALFADIDTAAVATAAEFRSGTASKLLAGANVWAGAAYVILADTAPIALDLSTGINFTVSPAESRQISFPTNPKPGQSGYIDFVQPAGGAAVLTFAAGYTFPGGVAPVVDPTPSRVSSLFYHVRSTSEVRVSMAFKGVR